MNNVINVASKVFFFLITALSKWGVFIRSPSQPAPNKTAPKFMAAVQKMAPAARALVLEPLAPDNATQTKKFFQTLHS